MKVRTLGKEDEAVEGLLLLLLLSSSSLYTGG